MAPGPEADPLYLDQILELIDLIKGSLRGVGEADFLSDRDKADATALRLGAIGELSRKLSSELRGRHPAIDWQGMYRLRNIISHHYGQLNYQRIWSTATNALGDLQAACRAELDEIDR
jgi:uncharacterized protein with HEPN domain